MRLTRVTLENFRCHKDLTQFDIGSLTAIIGKNDAGKSSVLDALQAFFDEKIESEDATMDGNKEECSITCEFEGFPSKIVLDAEYPTSLADEYLLNKEGKLEIRKVFNCAKQKPTLVGVFAVAHHPSAEGYEDLLELKIAELKKRVSKLEVDTTDVPLNVSSKIRQAIWKSCDDLRLETRPIKLDGKAEDVTKKVWDQLEKQMPLFQLFKSDRPSTDQDGEAQDPMKAAVKEAIKAQETRLEEIAGIVREQVSAIAQATVEKIAEMDPSLARQLHPHFDSPRWDSIFKISLTGENDIPVNKRGSGVRRLILLNFFRARAEKMLAEKATSNVIYAIEEPETSQHPNNQRMLMRAFEELAAEPGCQVIFTTHTPTLGRLLPYEILRFIDYDAADESRRVLSGNEAAAKAAAKSLGVLADHDVKLFIGLEGIHDINFFLGISKVLLDAGEDVPDLATLESEGKIMFIPLGGSNLAIWADRLAHLNRPELHVFDRDQMPPARSDHQDVADQINARDDCKAYLTSKREIENYLHPLAIKSVRAEVDVTFGDADDVPALAAKAVHNASSAPVDWDAITDEKREYKISRAKKWLNRDAVRQMTPAYLTERDPSGDVRGWLNEIKVILAR